MKPPYLRKSITLGAAGSATATTILNGETRYVMLIGATSLTNVGIRFGAQAAGDLGQVQTLIQYGKIGPLSGVDKIEISNLSGAPNTVDIVYGVADFTFSANAVTAATSIADGADVTQGAKADAAAGTDTGTFSIVALIKRLLTKIPGFGQATMAASLPVVIASDQNVLDVEGTAAAGTAIASAGKPIVVAGSDGTLSRAFVTDTTGRLVLVGPVAAGSAVGTAAPMPLAGSDGTNYQRVAAVADNAATPTVGNLTGVTGLYQSTARALTSARVAFLTVDRGGKVATFPCGTLDPVLAGYTVTTIDAAATTNAANLKATAAMVYEVTAVNNAAYDVFVKLFNKATAPTPGTDIPYRVVRVPAGQTVTVTFPGGAYFATGLGHSITKLVAKLDTTVLVAGDVQVSIQWA